MPWAQWWRVTKLAEAEGMQAVKQTVSLGGSNEYSLKA